MLPIPPGSGVMQVKATDALDSCWASEVDLLPYTMQLTNVPPLAPPP